MRMDWQLDSFIGPHPEFLSYLSTIADGCRNHTQKINDRCQVQMFPPTNGNTLNYLTLHITSHCHTPEAFDKTPGLSLYSPKTQYQRSNQCYKVTKSSAYAKISEKLHTSKAKHSNTLNNNTQTKQLERRENSPLIATYNCPNVQYSINLRYKTPKADN